MEYGYNSIEDIILTILAVLVILILVGTIYSIIRAIIQFVFSNGETDKIKKARNGIRYTIIGMIITVLLLFFFPILFSKIGSQNASAYSANAILERAMRLTRKVLSIGSSTGIEGVKGIQHSDGINLPNWGNSDGFGGSSSYGSENPL